MLMSQAIVNQKGARRIRGGHLWIYKSDVLKVEAAGGDVVSVFDETRNFIGKAFYSDKSEITLRIFTVKNEEIDKDFWRKRILEAAARRNISLPAAATSHENSESSPVEEKSSRTDAKRLIYSEGDLIPSLIVDDYSGVFVIQTLSQGTEKLKQTFVEILTEEFAPAAIVERNDVKVRERENLLQTKGILSGAAADEIVIKQDGLKFHVAPLSGQKTGSFLDQRENHFAMRKYAHGRGLDCFTFNGGFALNISQSCETVLALDISEEAIKLAARNAELNAVSNVRFQTANVFDALREFESKGEKFDTIILDPPAFVKNRAALKSAVRGYKEINLRALKLLNSGGILATCSCSFHFSEDLFLQTIEQAARDAKRRVHLLEKRMQAQDHPVLLGVPETHYLKCFILRVID